MVARSITFFDDADTDEMPRLLEHDISWKDVKDKILEETKKLYA
jgi:hypothetical protein